MPRSQPKQILPPHVIGKPVYGSHRDDLKQSAISDAIIEARQYRTVTERSDLQLAGFPPLQRNVPTLLIPIYTAAGNLAFYQSKPNSPRHTHNGKAIKYETPAGFSMVVDVPPTIRQNLLDPSIDLWITEGVKKADSLVSHGLTAIDLLGVWNWRGTNSHGGKTMLPEFDSIALNGRKVILCFDSDATTKKSVQIAMQRLADALAIRGAVTLYRPLDGAADGEKLGVDDFLKLYSVSELLAGITDKRITDTPYAKSADMFAALLPVKKYVYLDSGALWLASGVKAAVRPVDGEPATAWIDTHNPVDTLSWVPGEEKIIEGRILLEGGWEANPTYRICNLYKPPTPPVDGDPTKADLWLDLIHTIYPDDTEHILDWFAHRVQRPGEKLNHALVLGGSQGIGKDTLIEPVRRAVGGWNMAEVGPTTFYQQFNSYLKSVILRVSEVRDIGETNRYNFYEHLKPVIAAPPMTHRINEKFQPPFYIPNACGVIITTNHLIGGLFVGDGDDDRRYYVAWSQKEKEDFPENHWDKIYKWFADGGSEHVTAYLYMRDISKFNASAPPTKTDAFWQMSEADRPIESPAFADLLDKFQNRAFTLNDLRRAVNHGDDYSQPIFGWSDDEELLTLLNDKKYGVRINRRIQESGFSVVPNPYAKDHCWVINLKRVRIYAPTQISNEERIRLVQERIQVADND